MTESPLLNKWIEERRRKERKEDMLFWLKLIPLLFAEMLVCMFLGMIIMAALKGSVRKTEQPGYAVSEVIEEHAGDEAEDRKD